MTGYAQDLVLSAGTWFDPPTCPVFEEMTSFAGPAELAQRVRSYGYVEGYVLTEDATDVRAAAWCVDQDSRLLAGPMSTAYIGVALTAAFRQLMRRRTHAVAALHSQQYDQFRLLRVGLRPAAILPGRGRPSLDS